MQTGAMWKASLPWQYNSRHPGKTGCCHFSLCTHAVGSSPVQNERCTPIQPSGALIRSAVAASRMMAVLWSTVWQNLGFQ